MVFFNDELLEFLPSVLVPDASWSHYHLISPLFLPPITKAD
jgi:hypothetical protein